MPTAAERLAQRRVLSSQRPSIDLSDRFGDVRDQGPRPTCVAVALAGAHGVSSIQSFEAAIEPLWWDLHHRGETSAEGVTVDAAGAALARTGHCLDPEWPYNSTLGYGTEDPPTAAGPPPWQCATLGSFALAQDGVEDQLEATLALGKPAVLVVEVTADFELADQDTGLIAVPSLRAPSGGYHAVLAVGAWTEASVGRVILIRNSWGEFWGAAGYGLLPLDYLIAHAQPKGWTIT